MATVTPLVAQDIMIALPEPIEAPSEAVSFDPGAETEYTMLYISFGRAIQLPHDVKTIHFGADVEGRTATRQLSKERLASQLPPGALFQFAWRLSCVEGAVWGYLDQGMLQIGIDPDSDAGEVTSKVYSVVRAFYSPRVCVPKIKVRNNR